MQFLSAMKRSERSHSPHRQSREKQQEENNIPLILPKVEVRKATQKHRQAKKTILEDAATLANLEIAFRSFATFAQAADHAQCSLTALKKHYGEKTPVVRHGEEVPFDELVNSWRGSVALRAKLRLLRALEDRIEGVATAKWLLERIEREEFHAAFMQPIAGERPIINQYEAAKKALQRANEMRAAKETPQKLNSPRIPVRIGKSNK